jgi:hypothetical protein|tara:strand:- start:2447 stop:2650 length:204 start_codon:yes stop_codon:yes gene_type:complete
MDKYDQAIEFLKGVDPGSYYDECAALMEELLALTQKPRSYKPSAAELARLKQMDGGARYYAKVRGLL